MNNYEDINEIETTNIENFDGILRERVRKIIEKQNVIQKEYQSSFVQ